MNHENSDQDKKDVPEVKAVATTAAELARQLEKREVRPDGISEGRLFECAEFLRTRGCSIRRIAEIIDCNPKKVQRYFQRMRKKNIVKVDKTSQAETIGNFLNGARARAQRVLELSCEEGLSWGDQVRAIMVVHQIEKDILDIMERFGCLDKNFGSLQRVEILMKEQQKSREKELTVLSQEVKEGFEKLQPEQLVRVYQICDAGLKSLNDTVGSMVRNLLRENEQKLIKKYPVGGAEVELNKEKEGGPGRRMIRP